MTPERWQTLERLFEQALAAENREALFESISDAELALELRALLDAHVKRHPLLDQPTAAGTRLGPYVIERELGSGGMGTVYLGRRADAQFEKKVAIKLLHTSRLDGPLYDRFQNEQRFLAQLEHPYIAHILDAGISTTGVPYLVMEYVDGESLALYVERVRPSINERLTLFMKVCQAVHYSHQNLIIHRDIKPGNILVAAGGEPKLLDFGTAKLLGHSTAESDSTQTHVTLTPKYASPEQVRRDPISMATDVYSLGVVLYELLTGHLPYPEDCLAAPLIYQTILDYDPPPASRTGAATQGDLDCIIGRTLRKDPRARYASVAQLSDDIDRHLKGLPVSAQPDSFSYRASKFVKRNWVAVAAAAAVILAMAAGTGMALWQARIARGERAKAVAVSDFLLAIITNAKPSRSGSLSRKPVDLRLVDLLDESSSNLGQRFAFAPDIEVSVRNELASAYHGIQQFAKAKDQSELALALARRVFGDESQQVADCLYVLGSTEVSERKFPEAEQHLRKAVDRFERLKLDNAAVWHARTSLGLALLNQRKSQEALALFLRVFEHATRKGDSKDDVAITANNIAALYYDLNDRPKFREWIERSVELFRKVPEPQMAFGSALNNLAQADFQDKNYPAAIARMDEAIAFWRRFFGPDLPQADLATALANGAIMRTRAGEPRPAIPLADEALSIYRRLFPEESPSVAHGLDAVGRARCGAGEFEAGLIALRQALWIRQKTFVSGDVQIGTSSFQLGKCLLASGNAAEAEPLMISGYQIRKARFGDSDPALPEIRAALDSLHKVKAGRR